MPQQAPCVTPGGAIPPVVCSFCFALRRCLVCFCHWCVCVSRFVLGKGEAKGSFALEVTLWGPPFLGLTISPHFL